MIDKKSEKLKRRGRPRKICRRISKNKCRSHRQCHIRKGVGCVRKSKRKRTSLKIKSRGKCEKCEKCESRDKYKSYKSKPPKIIYKSKPCPPCETVKPYGNSQFVNISKSVPLLSSRDNKHKNIRDLPPTPASKRDLPPTPASKRDLPPTPESKRDLPPTPESKNVVPLKKKGTVNVEDKGVEVVNVSKKKKGGAPQQKDIPDIPKPGNKDVKKVDEQPVQGKKAKKVVIKDAISVGKWRNGLSPSCRLVNRGDATLTKLERKTRDEIKSLPLFSENIVKDFINGNINKILEIINQVCDVQTGFPAYFVDVLIRYNKDKKTFETKDFNYKPWYMRGKQKIKLEMLGSPDYCEKFNSEQKELNKVWGSSAVVILFDILSRLLYRIDDDGIISGNLNKITNIELALKELTECQKTLGIFEKKNIKEKTKQTDKFITQITNYIDSCSVKIEDLIEEGVLTTTKFEEIVNKFETEETQLKTDKLSTDGIYIIKNKLLINTFVTELKEYQKQIENDNKPIREINQKLYKLLFPDKIPESGYENILSLFVKGVENCNSDFIEELDETLWKQYKEELVKLYKKLPETCSGGDEGNILCELYKKLTNLSGVKNKVEEDKVVKKLQEYLGINEQDLDDKMLQKIGIKGKAKQRKTGKLSRVRR